MIYPAIQKANIRMNRNSETYRLLVTEAVEFLYYCMHEQNLDVKEISQRYLSKQLTCLSYGALLQQLINDHVRSYEALQNKVLKETDHV